MSKNNKGKHPKDDMENTPVTPNAEETAEVVQEVEILDSAEIPAENEAGEAGAAEETVQALIEAAIREQEDKYLRLLAEYDNFRKRSIKEREAAWSNARADAVAAFFPVYDNLERALKQECKDEAYAKGVQMTMSQMKTVLEKLGIEEIAAEGATFDPELHDAVMHIEDESLGQNVIAEVFQTGFRSGGRVIRHAMVKVAN